MSIRKDVQTVIDGIREGKVLETFDRYWRGGQIVRETFYHG